MTRKILIVEDEDTIRVPIKFFLMRLDARLMEARNGLEGLGIARAFKPHLIITDLSMPVMDGVEFIKQVRADVEIKTTPILVITGMPSEQQQEAHLAGANTILVKPFTRRDLINIVEVIINI